MSMSCRIRGACLACFLLMLTASPLPARELTLQQAVENASNNNPTIAAGRLSALAANQAAEGARALANPEVVVAPPIIGDAGADTALLFSQPLELNGSRKIRGEIASNQAAAAGYDAQAIQREVVLRTTETYWDVARAQELVKLNEDNVAYLETVRAAVQKQYDVGAAPGAQLLKMDVELARARQELAQARLELSQSTAALVTLMGASTAPGFTVSTPLVFAEPSVDAAALRACAQANRPEIASARALVSGARGQVRSARLQRAPDLAVQARRESFESDSDSGVAIAIDLPLLDWGSTSAEKRRAETTAQAVAKQQQAVQNQVSLEVEQALQRVDKSAQIVNGYQGQVLANSEELAAMARKGFEKGANSYLEVLEAQRTLRAVRSEYYSALAEHAQALAQLEWAAACPVTASGSPEVKK